MTIRLRNILLLAIIVLSIGCVKQTQSQTDLKNINRVISGIEARQDIELRVIESEQKMILQLKENYKKVNSDGMRDKISREIVLKESVIEKSQKNKANQEVILDQLYVKRDSIVELVKIAE